MGKTKKIIISVLIILAMIVVMISVAFVVVGHVVINEKPRARLVTVDELIIPAHIDKNLWGLVFYNPDGSFTHSTEKAEKVNFDVNKPTMIFFHGVQLNTGYKGNELIPNVSEWLNSGYNVASFLWSQYADDDPYSARNKIWSSNVTGKYKYNKDGVSTWVNDEPINYSMAECFVAYYVDFMSKVNYSGSYIHFSGLSAGASLLFAVSSYMLTLESERLISAEILPDRETYFDAFLDSGSKADDPAYINWLHEPIGIDGTAGRACETLLMLKNRGIAVEYIGSSPIEILLTLGTGRKDLFEAMIKETAYLKFANEYSNADVNEQHVSGKNWFFNSYTDVKLYADSTEVNADSSGICGDMPIVYSLARRGAKYSMGYNDTKDIYTDDVLFSNVEKPKIAGIAYFDKNNNGVNDDRLYNRISNIKVDLLDGQGNVVATTKTNKGGYYEFELAKTDVGKSYGIKIDLMKIGYSVAKGDSGLMPKMGNGLNANGASKIFSVNYGNDIKVINIGLKAK